MTASFSIGKGIQGANGKIFNVYGQPLPNSLTSDFKNAGLTNPMTIVSPTNYFDVSDITENHEIPVVLFVESGSNVTSTSWTYTFQWYRKRDNKLVFKYTFSDSVSDITTTWMFSGAAWIGWLSDENNGTSTYPQYVEIQENGDYYVTLSISGGYSYSGRIDFTVMGIPSKLLVSNITTSGFDWETRLSNYFNTSNYIEAGVCTENFTDGQTTIPNGVVGYNSSPSTNDGSSTSGTVVNHLSPSTTYTIYGFAQAANGSYYHVGSPITITTLGDRPQNFSWTYPKVSGDDFNLTASEWNSFTDRINQFLIYKNRSTVSFTRAPSGDGPFFAYMFNEAANAFTYTLNQYSTYPYNHGIVQIGDTVYAYFLNDMVQCLNNVY